MKKKQSKEMQRIIDYLDKAIAEYKAKYGDDYDERYKLIRQERTDLYESKSNDTATTPSSE